VALQPLADRLSEILLERGMLMKRSYRNSILVVEKLKELTSGPIAVTIYKQALESSSSITRAAEVASTHASSWVRGKVIYWSMTMVAIRSCSPLHAKKHHPVLS
jgi:hypothetical protein